MSLAVLGLLLILLASPAWAAVTFDNTATMKGSGVTSLTTPAFTITAAANRAGLLGLSTDGSVTVTAGAGSTNIGGVAAVAIAGTDSGQGQATESLMWGVTAPPAGSQTAKITWNFPADAVVGAVTASGVDQTTPFNNGTAATGVLSITITSQSGDLTIDTASDNSGTALSAPTQTQRWNALLAAQEAGAGSTGPGTGTTTHSWTGGAVQQAISGANFKQAAGGGGGVPKFIIERLGPDPFGGPM